MRWEDWRSSDNVEDRRDEGGGGGGGGCGMPGGAGGLGVGTVVVLGLVGWALGMDPRVLIGGADVLTRNSPSYQQPYQPPIQRRPAAKAGQPKDEAGRLVSKVLAQNEDRWREVFQQSPQAYETPHLVLFPGRVNSACGFAQSALGPIYFPRLR